MCYEVFLIHELLFNLHQAIVKKIFSSHKNLSVSSLTGNSAANEKFYFRQLIHLP